MASGSFPQAPSGLIFPKPYILSPLTIKIGRFWHWGICFYVFVYLHKEYSRILFLISETLYSGFRVSGRRCEVRRLDPWPPRLPS